MPEGQSRAEGEQAGSRAEQGPERRGNISVSSHRYSTAPTGREPLHGTASPRGALGPRAKVSGKVDTQLGSSGSRKHGGDGREGTLSGSLLSGLWGPLLPMRKGPGRPVGSSLFCLRAAYQLPAILSRCLFCLFFCILANAQSVLPTSPHAVA